jgi:hypothetical protein
MLSSYAFGAVARMTEKALSYAQTENIGYRTPHILFMLAAGFRCPFSNHSRPTRTPSPQGDGMTRQEVLRHIVLQARSNGFDFRGWYRAYAAPEWLGFDEAIDHLCQGRNCYALLFSHEFAQAFWKAGLQMSFMVPAVSYPQRRKDGQIVTVHRRAFARRMLKADSWLYHLREMVEAPHPLKYIRRFVVLQEDIVAAQQSRSDASQDPPVRDNVPAANAQANTMDRGPVRLN